MIRNLKNTDYKQYIKLIDSNISEKHFNTFLTDVLNKNHLIIVIEEEKDDYKKIIGSGTLLVEEKLTYGGCKMGHIENIFINSEHRNNGHGEDIVKYLLNIAKIMGCYRVDLNCHSKLEKFYKKNNFSIDNISMNIYFKENFK